MCVSTYLVSEYISASSKKSDEKLGFFNAGLFYYEHKNEPQLINGM